MKKLTLVFIVATLASGCETKTKVSKTNSPSFAMDLDYSTEEMFEFEAADYFEENAEHLNRYAEIISHVAAEKRISPRFLIALMEAQSGAVGNPEFDSSKPFGELSDKRGFLDQARDMCARLRKAAKPGDTRVIVDDPHSGILAVLTADEVRELGDAYQRLFPGVISRPPVALRAASQIPMQFPYPIGKKWYFGGAHADDGSGSIMSSLDFMKRGDGWGDDIQDHVVASAPGRVKVHSSCYISIVHDGDWTTGYYHLDDVIVKTGDIVRADQPIAKYANNRQQAICMGGSSDGPHVHWTLMRGNKASSLSGIELSGWTVHPGSFNYDDNCSRMYFHKNGEKLCPWTPFVNEGAEGHESCDGQCSSTCRCREGEGSCDDASDCLGGLICEGNGGTGTCEKDPAAIPRVALKKSTFLVNEPIIVNFYNLPGSTTDWVGTYRPNASDEESIDWKYTGGAKNGTLELPGLAAGEYEVRLYFNDSYDLEQKVAFTVKSDTADLCPDDPDKTEPGECGCGVPEGTCQQQADPYIEVSKPVFSVNEAVFVSFYELPGNNLDWVGTYKAGAANSAYIDWTFMPAGETDGIVQLPGLPEGNYEVRLFFNDSYTLEYKVSFTVKNDVVDRCPDDPDKIEPGECGCGVPEGTCQIEETPYIEMSQPAFAVNEEIVIHFYNLPGNPMDWVGTYREGTSHYSYIDWAYTLGAKNGTIRLPGLPQGDYEARLYFNDSYNLEHKISFVVK